MLDADNLPLIDPQQLMLEVPWEHAGNLFWPDYFKQASGGPALNPEGTEDGFAFFVYEQYPVSH